MIIMEPKKPILTDESGAVQREMEINKQQITGGAIMDRLGAFEQMLEDILQQAESEEIEMEKLKAAGKEKTAAYRQYLGNRMFYKMILDKYRQYGLLDERMQYGTTECF
jgi:hypothetical protein